MTVSATDRIPTEHFESMDRLESTYWWHQNRIRIATALLAKADLHTPDMLDLGCGTGNFASTLARRLEAERIIGVDASPTAIEYSKQKKLTVVAADLSTPDTIAGGNFDLVTAMDVIEHMETDSCILETARINLKPGGCLLLSAPAYATLFSHWDRQLHHYRRYTRKMFRDLVNQNHFDRLRCTYAFSYALPPAVIRKLTEKNNPSEKCEFPAVPSAVNALLGMLGTLEAQTIKHINIPAGLSVYMLLRKK